MLHGLTAIHLISVALACWLNRRHEALVAYVLEENRVLREQLGERTPRFTNPQRRRLGRKAHALGRHALNALDTLVTPDTLLRWHREQVARKWTHARRGVGRPATARAVVDLVLRMAEENPSWGYDRIVGALSNLEHYVSPTTVRNILNRHGIVPAPERKKHTSWSTFLKAHWALIWATDFFTVEVWTLRGLTTHYMLFVIHLASRQVHVAGITARPDAHFMSQVARQLTDSFDGPLVGARFLIMNRDTKFTAAFKASLRREGVESVLCPPRSPNCNAFAERFVRSIKEECLAKVIPIGVASVSRCVREFLTHYHHERNHQGLGDRLITTTTTRTPVEHLGPVRRRERLGGVLNYYYRKAA